MTDRRHHFANERVAHESLAGLVDVPAFSAADLHRVSAPVEALRFAPGGPRDTEVVFGEAVEVIETRGGWAFARTERDGYVGYLSADALGPAENPTHAVSFPIAHLYGKPDVKSPDLLRLPFGAELRVVEEDAGFGRTARGWVPMRLVTPLPWRWDDPVAVAERLLGTPYLWGGRSGFGVDCSGLVQSVMTAAGLPCPRDSDQQAASLGEDLAEDEEPRRGDLIFWNGHVGLIQSPGLLIHANAHHMAVASEPLDGAIARIGAKEFGGVTRRKRAL